MRTTSLTRVACFALSGWRRERWWPESPRRDAPAVPAVVPVPSTPLKYSSVSRGSRFTSTVKSTTVPSGAPSSFRRFWACRQSSAPWAKEKYRS